MSLVFATCSISVGTTSDTWIIKCILQEPASCFTFSLRQGTAGGEVWTLESLVLFALLCCDQSHQSQDHEEQDSGDHLVSSLSSLNYVCRVSSEKEICLRLDHNTSLTGVQTNWFIMNLLGNKEKSVSQHLPPELSLPAQFQWNIFTADKDDCENENLSTTHFPWKMFHQNLSKSIVAVVTEFSARKLCCLLNAAALVFTNWYDHHQQFCVFLFLCWLSLVCDLFSEYHHLGLGYLAAPPHP